MADCNELLPELTRVMTTVNSLMSDVAALQSTVRVGRKNGSASSESANNYLPSLRKNESSFFYKIANTKKRISLK